MSATVDSSEALLDHSQASLEVEMDSHELNNNKDTKENSSDIFHASEEVQPEQVEVVLKSGEHVDDLTKDEKTEENLEPSITNGITDDVQIQVEDIPQPQSQLEIDETGPKESIATPNEPEEPIPLEKEANLVDTVSSEETKPSSVPEGDDEMVLIKIKVPTSTEPEQLDDDVNREQSNLILPDGGGEEDKISDSKPKPEKQPAAEKHAIPKERVSPTHKTHDKTQARRTSSGRQRKSTGSVGASEAPSIRKSSAGTEHDHVRIIKARDRAASAGHPTARKVSDTTGSASARKVSTGADRKLSYGAERRHASTEKKHDVAADRKTSAGRTRVPSSGRDRVPSTGSERKHSASEEKVKERNQHARGERKEEDRKLSGERKPSTGMEKRASFGAKGRAATVASGAESKRSDFAKTRTGSLTQEGKTVTARTSMTQRPSTATTARKTSSSARDRSTSATDDEPKLTPSQIRARFEAKTGGKRTTVPRPPSSSTTAARHRFEKAQTSSRKPSATKDETDGSESYSASSIRARFEAQKPTGTEVKRKFVPGKPRAMSAKAKKPTNTNVCLVCSKTVYPMEKIEADGKLYHKFCFRCAECKSTLRLGNYAALSGKIYCKPHLKQLFKLKGNYDEGFGREQRKTDWIKKGDNPKSSNPAAENTANPETTSEPEQNPEVNNEVSVEA